MESAAQPSATTSPSCTMSSHGRFLAKRKIFHSASACNHKRGGRGRKARMPLETVGRVHLHEIVTAHMFA